MGNRGPQPTTGQTPIFNLRLPQDLRAQLEEHATPGRPLSKEIIARLSASVTEEREIEKRFGNRQNYRITQILVLAIERAAAKFPDRETWLEDEEVFDFVLDTFVRTLNAMRPGEPKSYSGSSHHSEATNLARGIWQSIYEAGETRPLDRYRRINADLGPLASRPNVYRAEFERRRSAREEKLCSESNLLTWPSDDADEATWKQWGEGRALAMRRAAKEVGAEMIAEGKNPRIDEEDTF